ncbi:hypothetical protein UPYG_G00219810 [Umbra pygmaea]|uniref:G-protein coupled receptors family 1 profile domain-containing protein n=1 Tax=Umbra pygmaea TaxID=75934 RepID=A0ABD0WR87_UMBPY
MCVFLQVLLSSGWRCQGAQMNHSESDLGEEPRVNSSSWQCSFNQTAWEKQMEKLYFWFYILVFVPGLILNSIALWVLCRYIRKRNKAVIFMVNLALADLLHILSLPLRIHYYLTHTWPFGQVLCLLCFYLKYLNMYASIVFLVCISVQRCLFLLKPFCARRWRQRYDLLISIIVWLVVGIGCSPFIIMRISNPSSSTSTSININPYSASPRTSPMPYTSPYPTPRSRFSCFKDLPTRKLPLSLATTMMVLAELFGFLLPLGAIGYCSYRIVQSLGQSDPWVREHSENHNNPNPRSPMTSQHRTISQTDKQPDSPPEKQTAADKRRALRMVLSCSALFLFCFAPYHINFLLYLMVSQKIVTHCPTVVAVRQFHPVSLCMASLSICLNPLLYYFLTAEFRQHLYRRTSSISTSIRGRLMSLESTSSFRGNTSYRDPSVTSSSLPHVPSTPSSPLLPLSPHSLLSKQI